MPKHVKMHTSKWHRKEENFFTHHSRSLKYVRFVENNSFCQKQWGRGGGGDFRLCPLSRAPGHPDWTKLAQYTTRSCILQNKTTTRPLRHKLRIFFYCPPVGPHGVPNWTKIAHAQLDHGGQQHETINGSLWYKVTEEIEEQDIVYGQKDVKRQTKGYRISSTGLWPVELKMLFFCYLFSYNLTKHTGNFSLINIWT